MGKIDIWKFTKRQDDLVPAFTGVYYDAEHRVAVATSGQVLLESKPDYVEGECNIVLDRKGRVVGSRFPRYDHLFKVGRAFSFDRERLKENIKAVKELVKSNLAHQGYVKIGDYWYKREHAELLLKLDRLGGELTYRLRCDGVCLIRYDDANYRALIISNDPEADGYGFTTFDKSMERACR